MGVGMNNKRVLEYPVILKSEDRLIIIDIPDLNCITQAENIGEVMQMARDCIELMLMDMYEDGEDYPKPSNIEMLDYDIEKEIPVLVKINLNKMERDARKTRVKR